MKNLFTILALTAALALGNQAFADCGCNLPKDDCLKPKCEQCSNDFSQICQNCKEKYKNELYCRLSLDDCQNNQAEEIHSRYKGDLDYRRDKIKEDHKCLCDKLHASCLDKSAVKFQERILKDDFKDLKSKMKEMDKDFKSILRCEQKKEYRVIKREMKFRAKHAMKFCCKPKCNK